jgi:hypothetical protein
MTTKLYTVTVQYTVVFASERDDATTVAREFERALRTTPLMLDEFYDADISVAPMDHIPCGYSKTELPWGGDGTATIGQLIDEGAAPRYVERYAELSAALQALGKEAE